MYLIRLNSAGHLVRIEEEDWQLDILGSSRPRFCLPCVLMVKTKVSTVCIVTVHDNSTVGKVWLLVVYATGCWVDVILCGRMNIRAGCANPLEQVRVVCGFCQLCVCDEEQSRQVGKVQL
mmetsp:Transcript_4480/g.7687  ORF Transcript_4480/g.7687 Transcript_4480/m.7687 type:complete len:120 (-) Transcript_4480:2930-3289(-)